MTDITLPNTPLNLASVTKTDAAQTVGVSGNTVAFETDGYACLSTVYKVTAISGASAAIQFFMSTSLDGIVFRQYSGTSRMTAIGQEYLTVQRLAAPYYRYEWIVTGTTPSVTFTIGSTLKSYLASSFTRITRYADINFLVAGATSTPFAPVAASNVSVVVERAAGGTGSANTRLQASLDGVNYINITGNLGLLGAAGGVVSSANSNLSYISYRIIVQANASTGPNGNIYWAAN